MPIELSTVADDHVVLHESTKVHRFDELKPDSDYVLAGVDVHTLPRPPGEHLTTFATVNDVHFGETECGVIEGFDGGPILSVGAGETSYPETMNRGAIEEITAMTPVAVLAKGDLTRDGEPAEYQAFLDHYGTAFGDRLHHVRGNHDSYHGQTYASGHQVIDVPGTRLVLLDTVIPEHTTGQITSETEAWLDDAAASTDQPVLVFGHHHPWPPGSAKREPTYFGLDPDSSERLVDVIARRMNILGYFAGHTHRNRTRRFDATGDVPFIEIGCVKDFPGSWAEYRVFEGGVLQIHHRISTPDALAWSEQCRGLYADAGIDYVAYAFGPRVEDRCLPIWPR
ncbi:MAG: metallophosphoesterase [Acidimicrobiales bacterium]